MSCNGCRVLRKRCSDTCVLRTCLQWIDTPEAQGNATLLLAKFFGRSDLLAFISAVPLHQRPSLIQSLLYEACGRIVNPVNGAVGLLSSGNWHVCQVAVETALSGGVLHPIPEIVTGGMIPLDYLSFPFTHDTREYQPYKIDVEIGNGRGIWSYKPQRNTVSMDSEESAMTSSELVGLNEQCKERKLLNLFI